MIENVVFSDEKFGGLQPDGFFETISHTLSSGDTTDAKQVRSVKAGESIFILADYRVLNEQIDSFSESVSGNYLDEAVIEVKIDGERERFHQLEEPNNNQMYSTNFTFDDVGMVEVTVTSYQNGEEVNNVTKEINVIIPDDETFVPEAIRQAQGSCGVSGVTMYFERSGIVVSPFELDVMEDENKMSHARARVSYEAGDLLANNVAGREPVSIWSEKTKVGRFMLPDNYLELGEDDAHIKMHDELQIFQKVEINKDFGGSWTLSDVIDYIYTQIEEEDHNGVIIDWKESEENIGSEERYSTGGGIASRGLGALEDFTGGQSLIKTAGEGLESMARNRYSFLSDDANLQFDGENGLSALMKVADEYGVDVFTKNDGVMYIGSEEDDVDFFIGSFDRDHYNLINYSVPPEVAGVKGCVVEGQEVLSLEHDSAWEIITGDNNVYMRGIALRDDVDDGNIVTIQHDSRDGSTLSQVAENKLREIVARNDGGSATVDLLSSDRALYGDEPDIRHVSIDDVLVVPDDPSGMCQRVPDGIYFIDSIHHKINPRVGWTINLGLKRLILTGESNDLDDEFQEMLGATITSAAYGYDTSEDEVVEDIGTPALHWGEMSIAGIEGEGFKLTRNEDLSTDLSDGE